MQKSSFFEIKRLILFLLALTSLTSCHAEIPRSHDNMGSNPTKEKSPSLPINRTPTFRSPSDIKYVPLRRFIVKLSSGTQTIAQGNGVFIGSKKESSKTYYYVITARHVLDQPATQAFPIRKVLTFDNEYEVTNSWKLQDSDLALVEFAVENKLNLTYSLPKISAPPDPLKTQCTKNSQCIGIYAYRSCEYKYSLDDAWQTEKGKIKSSSQKEVSYDILTVPGMSGGGIFIIGSNDKTLEEDLNAPLIAIHTNADKRMDKEYYDSSLCKPLSRDDGNEKKYYDEEKPNFGVPISLFFKEYKQLKNLPDNIEWSKSDNESNEDKLPINFR